MMLLFFLLTAHIYGNSLYKVHLIHIISRFDGKIYAG